MIWTKSKRNRVKKIFELAKAHLRLVEYDLELKFMENQKEHLENFSSTVAETIPSDVYLEAVVLVYPEFLGADEKKQYLYAVHELLHILLSPVDYYAKKAVSPANEEEYIRDMENVVVKLSRIICNE